MTRLDAPLDIRLDDLAGGATRDLLTFHLAEMHANSPSDSVFALDLSALRSPSIRVWTAWYGTKIAGVGALRKHDDRFGEIKSMRTHSDFLRQGVARFILDHIVDVARGDGFYRLALETGSGDAFDPALRLYRQKGFVKGPAFGDYVASPFNQFLHLDL